MKSLKKKDIKDAIQMQCLAKFRPRRVTIPPGWKPKNAYERNIVLLLARHDPRYNLMSDSMTERVLKWAG